MTNEKTKEENNIEISDFEKNPQTNEENNKLNDKSSNEVKDESDKKEASKSNDEDKVSKPKKEDKSNVKPVHKKSTEERIQEKVEEKFNKIKESGEMWVTLADENKNYWNSADEAYFMITQGRCQPLPEKITPIIENALGNDNPLLREAEDKEIKNELLLREKEDMVGKGLLSTEALKQHKEDYKVF